jgi:hypothetical protein
MTEEQPSKSLAFSACSDTLSRMGASWVPKASDLRSMCTPHTDSGIILCRCFRPALSCKAAWNVLSRQMMPILVPEQVAPVAAKVLPSGQARASSAPLNSSFGQPVAKVSAAVAHMQHSSTLQRDSIAK